MEYDRGNSFPPDFEPNVFFFKPNVFSFVSKYEEKMSPESYFIQYARKWKSSFHEDSCCVCPVYSHRTASCMNMYKYIVSC